MNAYKLTITTDSAAELSRIADAIEQAVAGPAVFGLPIIFDLEGVPYMSEVRVKDTQEPFGAHAKFVDSKGNETVPDTTPTWDSSNEDVATIETSDDGLTATVTVVGATGEAVIGVETTETHDGEGDPTVIRAVGTVIVEAGDTTTGSIEFDVPATP